MSDKRILTQGDIEGQAASLAADIAKDPMIRFLWGVPRGGIPAAYAVLAALQCFKPGYYHVVQNYESADLIVDDIIDSGATRAKYLGRRFASLMLKRNPSRNTDLGGLYGEIVPADQWVVFPWEGDSVGSADDIPRRLLQHIGEDVTREGLQETPARFLRAWEHWASGYNSEPADVLKTFEDGAQDCDEMVIQTGIPVYSHCEHHLAPFFGEACVAYIPDGKIVGLSKISRVVDILSRRLQVQERLTNQIASAFHEVLAPKGVAVMLKCRHLCMESRGISRAGVHTTTSALRGAMLDQPAARAEFYSLIRGD